MRIVKSLVSSSAPVDTAREFLARAVKAVVPFFQAVADKPDEIPAGAVKSERGTIYVPNGTMIYSGETVESVTVSPSVYKGEGTLSTEFVVKGWGRGRPAKFRGALSPELCRMFRLLSDLGTTFHNAASLEEWIAENSDKTDSDDKDAPKNAPKSKR